MAETAKRSLTVALAGNPNAGKTTIFNSITGARQHVGNYPGVTVDIKEGAVDYDDTTINWVDLPGTYSLTAYSEEEMVSRRFILDEKPDVIIDVIDTSNLERNLYLAIQLMEMNIPLILVFNMSDVAEKRGISFNREHLSRLLGAPIIRTVGSKSEGIDTILKTVIQVADQPRPESAANLFYGRELEDEICKIEKVLARELGDEDDPHLRKWRAIKFLEDDGDVTGRLGNAEIARITLASQNHIKAIFRDNPEIVIADRRYGFISGVCTEAVRVTVERRHDISDKIDTILINRVMGIPIFLILMYLVFQLTFTVGAYPMEWLEMLFGGLSKIISGFWQPGSESMLRSLLIDGIIGGVGGVIIFLPNILLLFMAIAVLEDSGYMARAAFIMDSLMHRMGLHGKSFIPMLIGFGCSVPGIMATRTIENRKDRFTTMLILPLMSCGARLPIYALFIPAFFPPAWHGPVLWIIYLIGIGVAIIAARLLKGTILKGEATPFIMELPPYRVPTARGVLIHTWERGREYVKKAGTIILGFAIVLWALSTYPIKTEFSRDYTIEREKAVNGYHTLVTQLLADESAADPAEITAFTSAEINQDKFSPKSSLIFPATVATIRAIESEFERQTRLAALDPEDPGYLILEADKRNHLNNLKQQQPQAYQLAETYLREIYIPFQRNITELNDSQQKEIVSYTMAGRIGHALEPLIEPLGFDWRIGTALIGALAAKEIFVAQLGIVFSVGDEPSDTATLRHRLREEYSPLAAFAIMIFCLLSTPCVATIAVTRKEANSWKWALVQAAGLTGIAYLVTLAVYTAGHLLEIGL